MPKSKMKRLPKFRDYDNPTRKNPYGWYYGHGKNRKYPTFKTKKAKNEFKEKFEQRFYSDRDALLNFDSEKWRKFCEFEKLAGGMYALEQAARRAGEFIEGVTLTFWEAAKLKIDDLNRSGGVNAKRVETYCERFVFDLGNRALNLYLQSDCQGWIDKIAATGEHGLNSIKNHHKAIASVFNLAVRLGHLDKSPAQYVTFPSGRGAKRFSLFEASDVQKLLNHIWQQNKALAGVYAILFFTGMRASMIAPSPEKRLRGEFIKLDMINAKDREIIIPPGIMKVHQHGLIIDSTRAPENLWPWLECIEDARIPEPSQTFNKRRAKLCKEVGLKWSDNVHRRSCASYYAAIRGKGDASALLGNTEKMIADHYQVQTFVKKAEAYFQVFPPKK